jgi:hypothetical protein
MPQSLHLAAFNEEVADGEKADARQRAACDFRHKLLRRGSLDLIYVVSGFAGPERYRFIAIARYVQATRLRIILHPIADDWGPRNAEKIFPKMEANPIGNEISIVAARD